MEDMRFDAMLECGPFGREGVRELAEDVVGLPLDRRTVIWKRSVDEGFGRDPRIIAGDLSRGEDEIAGPDSAGLTCGTQGSIPCMKGYRPPAESVRYC